MRVEGLVPDIRGAMEDEPAHWASAHLESPSEGGWEREGTQVIVGWKYKGALFPLAFEAELRLSECENDLVVDW